MKYSELDLQGATIEYNVYRHQPEKNHFDKNFLDQEMLILRYQDCVIDVGWYIDRYSIFVVLPYDEDDEESFWNPLARIEVLSHDDLFQTIQQVINDREKYLKLKVFL